MWIYCWGGYFTSQISMRIPLRRTGSASSKWGFWNKCGTLCLRVEPTQGWEDDSWWHTHLTPQLWDMELRPWLELGFCVKVDFWPWPWTLTLKPWLQCQSGGSSSHGLNSTLILKPWPKVDFDTEAMAWLRLTPNCLFL